MKNTVATFLEDGRGWATLQVQTHLLSQKPVMFSGEGVKSQVGSYIHHFKQDRLASLPFLRTPYTTGLQNLAFRIPLKAILLAGR